MTYTQILRGLAQGIIAYLFGKTYYVDSTNGVDTNSGRWPGKAFKTLSHAVSVAVAGDTIILAPSGSETLTAALSLAVANLTIKCVCETPDQGFLVQSAADIDLIQVNAAGVTIEGLRFKHTGTTTNRPGISVLGGDGTTAGQLAQRCVVRRCILNEAGADGKTDYGIVLTGNTQYTRIEDCDFRGCKYGVYIKDHASDTTANLGTQIRRCRFTVGKTGYFGIFTDGSNQVNLPLFEECEFFEALGTGAAATNAWDGSNGANATVGPLKLAATVDRGLIRNCRAYTAGAVSFVNLSHVVSGGTVTYINCSTQSQDLDTLLATLTAQQAVPTADATTNTYLRDVAGNKTDAVVQAETTNKSLMGYLKGAIAALCGTAGVAAWPSAAAPANGVSLAAALRQMYEKQGWRLVEKATGSLAGLTTKNLFTVTGLCEVRVVGVITTTIAAVGGAVTHEVGTSGNTAGILAQAADCRQSNGTLLLSAAAGGKTCGADVDPRIVNGATVLATYGAAPDSGEATYYCLYRPISSNGAVAAA